MGWPYKLRSDRGNHKGKESKLEKCPQQKYYLYYVKSAFGSITFTKTPADKGAEDTERQFSKEEMQTTGSQTAE